MIESIALSFGTAFAAFKLNEQSNLDVQPFDDVKEWFRSKFSSTSFVDDKENYDIIEVGNRFKVYKPKNVEDDGIT